MSLVDDHYALCLGSEREEHSGNNARDDVLSEPASCVVDSHFVGIVQCLRLRPAYDCSTKHPVLEESGCFEPKFGLALDAFGGYPCCRMQEIT